jgi:hypothetical protein
VAVSGQQGAQKSGAVLIREVQHGLGDSGFAGLRGPEALAQLPAAERQAWHKLWVDLADTPVRAEETTPL